ncbi:MAG: DUF4870 domain-containing protein [Tannerellaceae bacterium]|nr:DUF4870 domain-containing protein [Tannerellaceae bacterium]MCD8175895.1 DUF4870 domain-containing protein [Tannerellaceae bacterium]
MTTERLSPQMISDGDAEKASYAYLISTVILMVGLPFPLLNMIATFFFYLANRKRNYFVRFHSLQSLLSQVLIVALNSTCIFWTVSILLQNMQVSNYYFGLLFTAIFFNIVEFIVSLYATIQTRKKKDIRYFVFGPLTELLCKPEAQ